MSRIIALVIVCLAVFATTTKAQGSCGICVTVVAAIENWVESNATVAQVEQQLDTLCSLIPAFTTVCDQLIDYGIKDIVQYIQQNESPNTVCQQVGLCSSKKPSPKKIAFHKLKASKPQKVAGVSDSTCTGCEQVIGLMENWLANSNTESQIETYLETFCALVPGFEQTCDAIAQAGVPDVVNWIIQNENATVVCQQLGLCSSEKQLPLPKVAAPKDSNCDICVEVIGLIETYVESNATVSEIEQYLEALCSLIPGFSAVCDQIVQTGLSTIVSWIEQNENPKQICTQIGLCTSSFNKSKKIKFV